MTRQQCLVLYIAYSRPCVDIWDHNRSIDQLSTPKYNTQKEKHSFQNNQCRNRQSDQKGISECQFSDFDQIQSSNSKSKSIIWIYRRTRWTTHWQPAKFRQVGRCPTNRNLFDTLDVFMTRSAYLATVQYWPRLAPEAAVRNRCSHYQCVHEGRQRLQDGLKFERLL